MVDHSISEAAGIPSPAGCSPEQTAVVKPGLSRGIGLGDLQRSLPTSSALWFGGFYEH